MRFNIVQLCLANVQTDPRPNRIRNHLLDDPEIELISWFPEKHSYSVTRFLRKFRIKVVEIFIFILFMLSFTRMAKRFLEKHWQQDLSAIPKLDGVSILIIHDIEFLPLVVNRKAKFQFYLIFDLREYYVDQNNDSFYNRFIVKSLRKNILKIYSIYVDEFITVSDGLKNLYQKNFNMDCKLLFSTPSLDKESFDNTLQITTPLKIVHHGVANRNRQLEKMIDVVSKVSRDVMLDFYLTGDQRYITDLSMLIKKKGLHNVRILKPVTLEKLVPTLRQYHIGFFYVEPLTLNLLYCLPNKLFEYVHAGLCLIIGPSPDMAKITLDHAVGYYSKEFKICSVVELIENLTEDEIRSARKNSLKAAQLLNFEVQFKPFIERWHDVCLVQANVVES
jgi:hypothetical protein